MQLTKRQDGEGISPDSSLGRSIIPPEANEMQQHAFLGLEIQGDSDEDVRSRSSAFKSSIKHRRASLYQESSNEQLPSLRRLKDRHPSVQIAPSPRIMSSIETK